MSKDLITIIAITLVVAAITGVLAYWRSEPLSSYNDPSKGFEAKRMETTRFYVIVAVFVGVVSFFVYRWFLGRFPQTSETAFLQLALGIGVLLTVLALIFFRRAFVELTALHALHILAFGWIMPRLLF